METETPEELQAEIDRLLKQVAMLTSSLAEGEQNFGSTSYWKDENQALENYLNQFTVRQGALLTVAGLLTLLPLDNNENLKYLLVWTFPFLLISLGCFIFSSKRVNFVSKEIPIVRNEQEINIILKEIYYRSSIFYKATDVSIVVFLFSFFVNYYTLTFLGIPNLCMAIGILLLSIIFGGLRLWYVLSSKSRLVKKFDAIGGSPIETQFESMDMMDMDDTEEDGPESENR